MGRIQFIVPHRDRLPAEAIDLAYLANHEESPYLTRTHWVGDWLVADRSEAESATFSILWCVGNRPPVVLTTGTLIERPRPYLLPVELARGTLYRLRSYAFVWQSLGLVLPDAFEPLVKQAVKSLGEAATTQDAPPRAAELAEQTLEAALQASAMLCDAYGEQSVPARRQMRQRAPVLVGATLDDRPPDRPFAEMLLHACNTLAVPFRWSGIEAAEGSRSWQLSDSQVAWCQAHELRICGGPLVQLDAGALPGWLDPTAGFAAVQPKIEQHLQAVVERYRGRVHLWICAAAVNTGQGLSLTEEQRVRLAVRAIEVVRATDPQTPVLLTLDQPWGEYLRDESRPLSPIHFADVLVRGDLGLAGFGLRIDVGVGRQATLPRDVLEFSRQVERWSIFNLPLLIEFTLPAGRSFADHAQQDWIEQVVPVLLGKPAIQALFWGRLSDGDGDPLAERGLFDREGTPKPALRAFSTIRPLVE